MKKFVELIRRMHQERYSVVIDKIVRDKIPIAFLSISSLEYATNFVNDLRTQGVNVKTIITDNRPPYKTSQNDIEIVFFNDSHKIHPRPEYILTNDSLGARVALKYIPDSVILLPSGRNTEQIYETFMNNIDELYEVYKSLIDDESRRTFCGYLLSSVSNCLGEAVFANTVHYIAEGFIPQPDSIVMDIGAFDGATAGFFTDIGCKVYAFEMDSHNFQFAKKLSESKNFVIENVGLGSYEHEMRYTPNANMSTWDVNGSEVAKVITLDSYVRKNKIPRVDFIKFDVEGAELDVLKGATTTIARFKPILALSAYHKWDDFWVLMNFVKSIRSDYEFAMRQYATFYENSSVHFRNGLSDILYSFGLDVKVYWYNECVLFAR